MGVNNKMDRKGKKLKKPIYVETEIVTDMEKLWEYTQMPDRHVQWDLRFTEITYLQQNESYEFQQFKYRTRIGFGLSIAGTGETKSTIRSNGRLSTLTFGSEQTISLIRQGSGYWRYTPTQSGNSVTFSTQYDYETRFGKVGQWFDTILFRPLFGYATAWSFDTLRIWLEQQIPPYVSLQRTFIHYLSVLMLSFLWLYEGFVPKILFPEAGELAIMQTIPWFEGWEMSLLLLLGIGEMGLGLLTVIGHRCKYLYLIQILLLFLLAGGAIVGDLELLKAPFNPLTLSISMIGFNLLAYLSIRDLPKARRCLRVPSTMKRSQQSKGAADHGVDL